MARTPDEQRLYEREKKRRQRAAAKPGSDLPRIGADTAPGLWSVASETVKLVDGLEVPPLAMPLVAALVQLARDIDEPANVPQRAGLMSRYLELMDRVIVAARPAEDDPLTAQRAAFYRGEAVPDVRLEA